jgi:hypothetical protein
MSCVARAFVYRCLESNVLACAMKADLTLAATR